MMHEGGGPMLSKAYTKRLTSKKESKKDCEDVTWSISLRGARRTFLLATWAYAASLARSTAAEKDAVAVEEGLAPWTGMQARMYFRTALDVQGA